MPLEPEESLVRTKPCQGRINIELITCVIILFPTFTLGKALGPGETAAPMRIEEVAGSCQWEPTKNGMLLFDHRFLS